MAFILAWNLLRIDGSWLITSDFTLRSRGAGLFGTGSSLRLCFNKPQMCSMWTFEAKMMVCELQCIFNTNNATWRFVTYNIKTSQPVLLNFPTLAFRRRNLVLQATLELYLMISRRLPKKERWNPYSSLTLIKHSVQIYSMQGYWKSWPVKYERSSVPDHHNSKKASTRAQRTAEVTAIFKKGRRTKH